MQQRTDRTLYDALQLAADSEQATVQIDVDGSTTDDFEALRNVISMEPERRHRAPDAAESARVTVTDGGYERDEEAVIAVDWAAVERETHVEIPDELRHLIEHAGSADGVLLDRHGYREMTTTALSSAVKDHSQLIHPNRGPIDEQYLEVSSSICRVIQSIAYDRDLNIPNPSEVIEGDDTTYLEGLGALVDAAQAIDQQRDDWYTNPCVMMGSVGPDQLGSLCVHVTHKSEAVLHETDIDHLPIELERIDNWAGFNSNYKVEHHHIAAYRHERYASDQAN